LASRLAATVLGVGSASLIVATIVGVSAGQSLGRTIVEDSLGVLRSSASVDVVAQLRFYERVADQLAGGPAAKVAIEEFSSALGELSETPRAQTRSQRQQLLEAYSERYLAPLREGGDAVQLGDILSDDPAAIYLQATYGLPQAPITDPMSVDDADDGSLWSAAHARFHPAYRTAVRQAGLLDLYWVDAESERIVYSASKGPDLGTSLSVGPFSGSIVARAADAAVQADDAIVTDLSFYRAVPGEPVGAAAAPVRDGGQLLGVVVLTYPGSVYTDRLSALYRAATGGADGASDLYLIGTDGTTRSDPQAFLADPEGFLEASASAGGLTDAQRDEIERDGSTVLVLPAADATVRAALDGDTEVGPGTSITGAETVGVVTRLPYDEVLWYTVAELEASAAGSTVASFRRVLLVGTAVFVVLLAFVAVAWARQIMRPVRIISDRLGRQEQARAAGWALEPDTIPERSPVELHRLADSFTAMAASLRRQQADLRDARAERLGVLKRMLPTSIAQRIARGDIESLDQVPNATVAVVVVLGLGGLVGAGGRGHDRRMLDDLHAELDGIAFEHGLDRIKVVGDSYFAACGHDTPYLDHAPRVVAFAEDVAAAVRRVARSSATSLDTAIGISTGPVTVGMSGGARLVYDVWGPTVTAAHDLARSARAGQIVVTDATRARLPAEIELSPHENLPGPAGRDAREPGPRAWLVVPAGASHSRTGTEAPT
jgi:class 3 adenylate cyclase